MKKQIYALSLILLLSGMAQKSFAQIPNPSFETWVQSNDYPQGWGSTNALLPGSVVMSSTAHQGSSAAKLLTVNTLGTSNYVGSQLFTGDPTTYTPHPFFVSSAPVSLHGWYISSVDSGDQLQIASSTYAGTSIAGGGLESLTDQTSVYKEFTVTYSYISNNTDSIDILIQITNPNNSNSPHKNTYFIVDDLSFSGTGSSGVKDIQNTNVSLEQNYPNPAVDQTNIIYSLQSDSKVTLNIIDVLGRTVKTVINQTQTPGRYKAIVDVNDLPAGNYFYQLTAGGNFASNMMTVVK